MAPKLSPKKWALSHLFLSLTLLLSVRAVMEVTAGLSVSFLNVGQGDGILIRTPEHKNILIDAGPDAKVVESLGEVLPFFDQRIDLFILTHPHTDHYGGFLDILSKYPVGAVALTGMVSDDPLYTAMIKGVREKDGFFIFPQSKGDLEIGRGIFLDILYPFEGESLVGQEVDNKNNSSLAVLLRREGKPLVLLTGDAEKEQERELLLSGQDVQSPVYKAGHHGSRTSTTEAFLGAVSPKTVVISSGEGNSFGHPHPETLEKLKGLDVHRTDMEGTVTFVLE